MIKVNARGQTSMGKIRPLIPGPPTSAFVVLEGSTNHDFCSFSVAISVLLAYLSQPSAVALETVARLAVWGILPEPNDVNPIVTQIETEKYEYVSRGRLR